MTSATKCRFHIQPAARSSTLVPTAQRSSNTVFDATLERVLASAVVLHPVANCSRSAPLFDHCAQVAHVLSEFQVAFGIVLSPLITAIELLKNVLRERWSCEYY